MMLLYILVSLVFLFFILYMYYFIKFHLFVVGSVILDIFSIEKANENNLFT